MQYKTNRLILRPLTRHDRKELLDFYRRNREFWRPWEPRRSADFYTVRNMGRIIRSERQNHRAGSALTLYLFIKGQDRKIIGKAALSSIVRGPFLSAFAGYMVDKNEIRKGYATEALSELVRVAFEDLGLHRLEANIIPRNRASRALAEKNGVPMRRGKPEISEDQRALGRPCPFRHKERKFGMIRSAPPLLPLLPRQGAWV